MHAIVQIAGALLVLTAFVLSQFGLMRIDSAPSLWLNAVGAGTLAVLAYDEAQWDFLLLEGVWAAVAAFGLLARFGSGPSARIEYRTEQQTEQREGEAAR